MTPVQHKIKGMALVILSLMVLVPAILTAAETDKTVVVMSMGSGTIKNNDTSRAKKLAIKDGLVSAVNKAVTDIMPVSMLVANFKTVNEVIYNNANSFVQGYKVIAETKHNRTYRIILEATLSTPAIREYLAAGGIMLDKTNKPRVLFLVEETIPEDAPPLRWWEPGMSFVKTVSDDALTLHMRNKGFEVAAHRAIYQDHAEAGRESEEPVHPFSHEDAIRLGKYFEADFVITGSATATRLLNTMGDEKSFNGTIEVTCFNTETGEEVTASRQSRVAVNPHEMEGGTSAIAQASALVAQELSSAVASALKKKSKKPSMIEVIVEGTNFLENYARLNRELKTIDGVKRIKPREKRIDRAVIIVNYTGTGKALAKSLLAKNFTSFGLNISDVSRNHLKLAFVPRDKE